jgi:GNAT superfamily N-acetyltransferase
MIINTHDHEIRTLQAHEVDLHRELSLRAVRDSPTSFGETLLELEAQPPSYWEELTCSVTVPGPHIMLLAHSGDVVHGCVYGLRDRNRRDGSRVGGMWVEPAFRGRGIGHALVQAVIAWSREQGRARIGLWAPAHNNAAITLYTKAGFRENGRRRPLPSDPALWIIEMEVLLKGVDAQQ